jgi:type IV pilus assembly protein PilP
MAEIKARPRGRIEPPPEFAPVASVSYAAHQMRGPFTPPLDDDGVVAPQGRQVEPDFTRPREYLERFSLDSLKMVGSISRQGSPLEILVKDPTGAVNRVRVGNHMGKNFGRIIEVSETAVGVVETVPDGQDGWVERARTIKLVAE